MESNEKKLLDAIFGGDPQPKALKFSLNLGDVTVSVSITKNKKEEKKCCGCPKGCSKCGGQKQ